jgi:hypothetical protein
MQHRSTIDAPSNPVHTTRRRRAATVLAGTALAVAALATPASADGSPDLSRPHQHALLLHVDLEPFSYGTCVDLAGARALRTNTHHETVHTGKAGAALQRAGHLVIPYTCAQLEAALGE